MSLELLFLGSGTSTGVPMIGCHCDVCRSDDPRNHRTRPSVLIRYPDLAKEGSCPIPTGDFSENPKKEDGGALLPMIRSPQRQFLIDTTPEMRIQLIRHQIDRIDGVLFTHTHADHVFGIDDLRRFNVVMKSPVPVYAEQTTLDTLRRMFPYIFESHKVAKIDNTFVPNLIPQLVKAAVPVNLEGAMWTPLRLMHGRRPILGFRVDWPAPVVVGQPRASIAYCTDVSRVPPETYPLLENLDVLVIDALRYRHHPTHMTVDRALETIEQIKPKRAYLTHIAHDIEHADLESRLPQHVFLAFDGLTVDTAAI